MTGYRHYRSIFFKFVPLYLVSLGYSPMVVAQSDLFLLPPIVVTATRLPMQLDDVPADISIIRGEELRAAGAKDLRSALRLVAGVVASPGGDSGPASAVPSMWGLHEFDAFLLVVDGVPWGGAFNPSISTLNLNNVERIEVLRGAAPVIYGATSFVGVIQVIHYPAGKATNEVRLSYGSYGSVDASASKTLKSLGDYQQSIALDAQRLRFSDAREAINTIHLLYRGAGSIGDGTIRFDGNLTLQRQVPPSPVVRQGQSLTTLTPLNANFNPSNAKINEDHVQLSIKYLKPTNVGDWESTISVASSEITDIRGFLRSSLVNDGSVNADSQEQKRQILDIFLDTHASKDIGSTLQLVLGADLLYGRGRQSSRNGEYSVSLSDGSNAPSTGNIHVDEINALTDRRAFWGEYAQIIWKPSEPWHIVGGLRLNETSESKNSSHLDANDPSANEEQGTSKSTARLSGVLGASYSLWQQGNDEMIVFADYRNTFKPAALDFGPDYTPTILLPERATSYEAGIKQTLGGGRFAFKASVFRMKFNNLVLRTTDVDGAPIFRNAGGERLMGVEIESRWRLTQRLTAALNVSYHDARFTDGSATEGGANINLRGKQLTLSPHILSSVGFIYSASHGFYASGSAHYVGHRFLDLDNIATSRSYVTFDAVVGWKQGKYDLSIKGSNLSNRRPPVSQSEFGDLSYYLLPSRTIWVGLAVGI